MSLFSPRPWMVALALMTAPAAVSAQTLVFSEDWESGMTRWYAGGSPPVVATESSATAACSSHFQRETILGSGGRVFERPGIAVTGGGHYCLTSWVRGSTGTQPFVGINLSDAAGTPGAEHWLLGHVPWANGYGGNVTNAPADGVWHWLSAPFTVEASATYVIIKDELFSGGTAGSADFDDIQLWVGSCPTAPTGNAHAVCAAPTAVCTPSGACVQCTADSNCAGSTPFCDTAHNTCVACRTASDCHGATPRCDPAIHACVGCRADTDCGGSTPACQPGGACGQCSATNSSSCTGSTTVCDPVVGTCVGCTAADTHACMASGTGAVCLSGSCGCSVDTDCGDAHSGRICDPATHHCAAGCSASPTRNGCPDGLFCSTADTTGLTAGMCTTTCNFDSDCHATMPTRPLCLAGDAGASSCVQCRVDTDCAGMAAGRTLCDTTLGTCVECTSARTGACMTGLRGAACLMMGTCGCGTDTDCGDVHSGRVCDPGSSVCVPGCRASGGNGCPDGMTCSAADGGTAGTCAPIPDAGSDAGADGGMADATVDGGASDVPLATDVPQAADVGHPTDDSGVLTDSGAGSDAATPADSAPSSSTMASGGGCGCTVPAGGGAPGLPLLALLALAVGARRRRAGR